MCIFPFILLFSHEALREPKNKSSCRHPISFFFFFLLVCLITQKKIEKYTMKSVGTFFDSL